MLNHTVNFKGVYSALLRWCENLWCHLSD